MPPEPESLRVGDLCGLWRRSLLERADGSRDTGTWVRWLQGATRFADLRQHPLGSGLAGVRARSQLSREQCLELAHQEGFAGVLSADGRICEWHRTIDFQPDCGRSDAGSLHWEGAVLIERGRDVPYLEHWHRESDAASSPVWALDLIPALAAERGGSGGQAMLLRVGNWFMFARDRTQRLPTGSTLVECVSRAATLDAAQVLVDCEISFGAVAADARFCILRSSLPWRVNDALDPQLVEGTLSIEDRGPDGAPLRRRWEIIAREDLAEPRAGS